MKVAVAVAVEKVNKKVYHISFLKCENQEVSGRFTL